MARYVITFPARTMVLSQAEFEAAGRDSRAVIEEIKAAGAYVTASGINPEIPAVLVAADGTVTEGAYPDTKGFNGGITIVDVATRDEAHAWAAKIAAACRCPQEVRELFYDAAV